MRPVFICGCPRSGTTLLASMLGSHPENITVPEFPFKFQILGKISRSLDTDTPIDVLEGLTDDWSYKIWEIADKDIRHALSGDTQDAGKTLEQFVNLYTQRIGKASCVNWIDHTPMNLYYMHTLSELYPDASFVHIIRDGRAVAASVMPLDWGPNTIFMAANWWTQHVSYGIAAETALADRVFRITYEELVIDTERCLKRICEQTGIDYSVSMLESAGFEVPDYTRQQHELIGSPVDSRRSHQWMQLLSERQIEIFEWATHDYLSYLGYKPRYGIKARPMMQEEIQQMQNKELELQKTNEQRLQQRRRETIQ